MADTLASADAPAETPAAAVRVAPARRHLNRLVLGAALAWLVLLLVEWAADGRIWLGHLVGIVPPAAFALVPLLLAALAPLARGAARWRSLAAAALALVTGFGQSGFDPAALWRPEPGTGPDSVRVFAWNTNSWNQLLGTQDHFYAFLKAKDADVYLLHEYQHVTADRKGRLPVDDLPRLRREFPGHEVAVRGELVTLSRFPILRQPAVGPAGDLPAGADWQAEYRGNKVLRTDVRVKGRTVSFYNVHMPVWNSMPDGLLSAAFYRHMRERFSPRRAQYAGLEADLAANRNPVVVAGDFNATAAMSDLDPLRERLDDAADVSTDPYPTSWEEGGWKPFWRTDWAFTGNGAKAERYEFNEPEKLSDHAVQDLWVSLPGNG
ncbi:endonuclease/exonuclease/phosphatase family protein [Streptomyces flavochromogenes]|uniref:endonuclease/exonuclease/phosphatase family protein n=1 Tax=Streptomyces flavochromogenes TaxID=68199 RepID=UPI0004C05C46|nr:endonuclease/exonuclease/phosphatase family protein [Streptomyces flavochromogenes]